VTPNTTLDAPVSESITFTAGIGSFTSGGGDPVCVMGSGFNEESVTTSASGSAGTQTIVVPLTRNNVGVVVFKGHCGIIGWMATISLRVEAN
jgi:hypothetical protein